MLKVATCWIAVSQHSDTFLRNGTPAPVIAMRSPKHRPLLSSLLTYFCLIYNNFMFLRFVIPSTESYRFYICFHKYFLLINNGTIDNSVNNNNHHHHHNDDFVTVAEMYLKAKRTDGNNEWLSHDRDAEQTANINITAEFCGPYFPGRILCKAQFFFNIMILFSTNKKQKKTKREKRKQVNATTKTKHRHQWR